MFNFIKKLLSWGNFSLVKKQKPAEVTDTEQLMDKLLEMVHYEQLNELFYNPDSKLYVINTYSSDIGDLGNNLFNSHFNRQIIAINLHAYFLNSKVDIKADLEKIAKCLRTHKPSAMIQHDLYQLVETFEFLKSLES